MSVFTYVKLTSIQNLALKKKILQVMKKGDVYVEDTKLRTYV
jgi:hypothetical protein